MGMEWNGLRSKEYERRVLLLGQVDAASLSTKKGRCWWYDDDKVSLDKDSLVSSSYKDSHWTHK